MPYLHTITSMIRGGGTVGGSAWVARITGPDGKYGLARSFVRKSSHGTGRSGLITFSIDRPGVYELRGVGRSGDSIASQARSGGGWSGYIVIHPDGRVEELGHRDEVSPSDVLARIAELEA